MAMECRASRYAVDLNHVPLVALLLYLFFGAVPLSRETGFSPQKEEHDTKVVLPESRYDLSVLPPSLESVAAICVLALAEEGLCAKLDAGERN